MSLRQRAMPARLVSAMTAVGVGWRELAAYGTNPAREADRPCVQPIQVSDTGTSLVSRPFGAWLDWPSSKFGEGEVS
jgi:hypothetical protein